VSEEDGSGTKEVGVDWFSFAQGAKDEWVSRREVVLDIFSYDSSIQGRQFKVEVEGRVGVVGDPSFSGVVRVLLKEAGEAVVSGGGGASLIVRGAV
jgi:hypothetical protein